MSGKYNPRAVVAWIIILALFALLVSYLSARSLNPASVYGSHSLAAKVAVSVAGVMIALGLLGLLLYWAAVSFISKTAGIPAGDVICGSCGLPLMKFAGSYGWPMRCPGCKTWWHNGPNCYRKGAEGKRIVLGCPRCRAARHDDTDAFASGDL